jgi:hypothetical protein
MVGQLIEP